MDKREENMEYDTSIAPPLDEMCRAAPPGGVCCIVVGTDADAAAWRSLASQAGIPEPQASYFGRAGSGS